MSYTPYDEICLQGKGITFQIFCRVASWTMLRLGKKNKRKAMDVTSNIDLRRDLTVRADCLERAANSLWWNWDHGS